MTEIEKRIENFWYTEMGDTAQPATAEAIAEAERLLGVKLPEEFKALLRIQDGGVSVYDGIYHHGEFYPFFGTAGVSEKSKHRIVPPDEYKTDDEDIPPGVILFAGMGHSWVGFDYRTSDSPSIVYFDEFEDKLTKLADTFVEYLLRLQEE